MGGVEIDMITWIKSFLPVLGRSYWFASSYIILLAIIPAIRFFWNKVKRKRDLLIVLGIALSVFPTITVNGRIFGESTLVRWFFKLLMFGPVWFAYLYLLMDYLKTNVFNRIKFNKLCYFFIFGFFYGMMLTIEVVFYKAGVDGNDFWLSNYSAVRDMQSVLCIVSAFAFFLFFKELKIRNSRIINALGGMTFGIYLLHTHESSIPLIYSGIFQFNKVACMSFGHYLLTSCLFVGVVFIIGGLIEIIRKNIEEYIFTNEKFKAQLLAIQQIVDGKLLVLRGIDK